MEENNNFEAIIVGGSYAGLAAAMSLGRAVRRVLIIDGGKPCNRQTPHSHNFLTQDGNTPAAIAALGRKQVLAYPTVQFKKGDVVAVMGGNLHFQVKTDAGKLFQAKKVLFATGIKDEMPAIDGFTACWGISLIHCPYCHGYEYKNENTGVLVNGETALERAKLLHQWTKRLTIFTNGPSAIPAEHSIQLADMGIPIIEKPLQRIVHHNGHLNQLLFVDGSASELKALYAGVPFKQHCQIPAEMGCELTDKGHIQVDQFQRTTVQGIFAAGDNVALFRSVAVAVAAGTTAGGFINHELLE